MSQENPFQVSNVQHTALQPKRRHRLWRFLIPVLIGGAVSAVTLGESAEMDGLTAPYAVSFGVGGLVGLILSMLLVPLFHAVRRT